MSWSSWGDAHKENSAQVLSELHSALNEREQYRTNFSPTVSDFGAGVFPSAADIKAYAASNFAGRIEPNVAYFLGKIRDRLFGLNGATALVPAFPNPSTWNSGSNSYTAAWDMTSILAAGSYGSNLITDTRTTKTATYRQLKEALQELYVVSRSPSASVAVQIGSEVHNEWLIRPFNPANVNHPSVQAHYNATMNSAYNTPITAIHGGFLPAHPGPGVGVYSHASWLWYPTSSPFTEIAESYNQVVSYLASYDLDFSGDPAPPEALPLHSKIPVVGTSKFFGYDNNYGVAVANDKTVSAINAEVIETGQVITNTGTGVSTSLDFGTSVPSDSEGSNIINLLYSDVSVGSTAYPQPGFAHDGHNVPGSPEHTAYGPGHDVYQLHGNQSGDMLMFGVSLFNSGFGVNNSTNGGTFYFDFRPLFNYS